MIPTTASPEKFTRELPPETEEELYQMYPVAPLRELAFRVDLTPADLVQIGEFLDCAMFIQNGSPKFQRLVSHLRRHARTVMTLRGWTAEDLPVFVGEYA